MPAEHDPEPRPSGLDTLAARRQERTNRPRRQAPPPRHPRPTEPPLERASAPEPAFVSADAPASASGHEPTSPSAGEPERASARAREAGESGGDPAAGAAAAGGDRRPSREARAAAARARQDVTRQAGRWAAGVIRLNERVVDLEAAVATARSAGVDSDTLQQLLVEAAAHHGVAAAHLPLTGNSTPT